MKYLLENQQSERLIFRLLEESDFDTWLKFFLDDIAVRFLGIGKDQTPKEQCKEWFEKSFERLQNNQGGLNVLIDKETNEFIGMCGLLVQEVDNIEELEIGYSILPKHRNKGYATEAAKKCRDYAFENNFTDSLISIIHVENVKSMMVAKKNGMMLEKQTDFKDMPVKIFRITKEKHNDLK